METNTIKTVGVIIFSEDKTSVLLVEYLPKAEHLSNTFGIPVGRLEANAVRELKEETGLITSVNNLTLLPYRYEADTIRKDGTTRHFRLRTFLCSNYSGDLKEGSENRPVWIRLEDLDELNLLPNMKAVVMDALEYS